MENTVVNIYDKPMYASIALGSTEFIIAVIQLITLITNPIKDSNFGFYIGLQVGYDIIKKIYTYLLIAGLLAVGIYIIYLGIAGLKSRKPGIAVIGIFEGSASVIIEIICFILTIIQFNS